jgi:hypothetical protein
MDKDKLFIDYEFFKRLGIDPEEGIKYLENKDAIKLKPVHVMAHQILKQQTVASS